MLMFSITIVAYWYWCCNKFVGDMSLAHVKVIGLFGLTW